MKLFTYRYVFSTKDMEDGKIGVKVVTDTPHSLKKYEDSILLDDSVVSCLKEYVSEFDLSNYGYQTTIKSEVK